jgi:hypothetical protein
LNFTSLECPIRNSKDKFWGIFKPKGGICLDDGPVDGDHSWGPYVNRMRCRNFDEKGPPHLAFWFCAEQTLPSQFFAVGLILSPHLFHLYRMLIHLGSRNCSLVVVRAGITDEPPSVVSVLIQVRTLKLLNLKEMDFKQ